jgi:aspartate-semialdehyde dehydrogenase
MTRNGDSRIGVVGATGAVGTVTLSLLAERGYEKVRAFASARSAGGEVSFGQRSLQVEEATPEVLAAGDLDVCFFSISASISRGLVPYAINGGAVCIDKSAAFRLEPEVPLVVPEVNGDRALEHNGVIAVPNCCTIPLTCALQPLRKAAGIARVRVATYQSASGAGTQAMEQLRAKRPEDLDLAMDGVFGGEEFDEETKIRDETRKIMELPSLPISATCVRVPVLVGHAEAVWVETEQPLSAEAARDLLAQAPGVRLVEAPTPAQAAGTDDVLVGRVRIDRAGGDGLSFFIVCDNLRKGAALNAIQIAELLPASRAVAA